MNFIRAIRDKLAQVDEVVPILVFFELLYLGIGELIIWAFLPVNKPSVALGFAIGVGFAIVSSIQNAWVLSRALGKAKSRKSSSITMVIWLIVRIACIGGIVVLAVITDFCSPIAILIGVLSIQIGVYFEPWARKRRQKKENREDK